MENWDIQNFNKILSVHALLLNTLDFKQIMHDVIVRIIEVGNSVALQLLVRYGVDVRMQGNLFDRTLAYAAGLGQLECVKILLDAGCLVQPTVRNALDTAIARGHGACVRILQKSVIRTYGGSDASEGLINAIENRNTRLVDLFIVSGIDLRPGYMYAKQQGYQLYESMLGSAINNDARNKQYMKDLILAGDRIRFQEVLNKGPRIDPSVFSAVIYPDSVPPCASTVPGMDVAMLRMLIDAEAVPKPTLMHECVCRQNYNCLHVLMEYFSGNVNSAIDIAIRHAIEHGHSKCVEKLQKFKYNVGSTERDISNAKYGSANKPYITGSAHAHSFFNMPLTLYAKNIDYEPDIDVRTWMDRCMFLISMTCK